MEHSYGWMADLPWDGGEEKRRDLESELEMHIWRWALLEAHLREASILYERLMGSPLAPAALGRSEQPTRDWGAAPNRKEIPVPSRLGSGRSQGRRQRRRLLQHQKRGSQLSRPGRDMEQIKE